MRPTAARLDAWCDRWLGARVREVLFEKGHLSRVFGIRLTDGRDVVVKVRPTAGRLVACADVQRAVWRAGFPCPQPLVGPVPLDGYAANAEVLVAGGELLDVADDAVDRYAELLARLVRLAPSQGGRLAPNPPWVAWDHGDAGVWPPPDDRVADLNAHPESGWLDEIGERVRRRLRGIRGVPPVVGHGDWEAQNLRWRDRTPWVVHDWDSVISAPEPVVVGLAASVWPCGARPACGSTRSTRRRRASTAVPGSLPRRRSSASGLPASEKQSRRRDRASRREHGTVGRVIVWINGAFGAGKSTTAGLLLEALEGARLFDPEYVGYLLQRFVPVPTGDFQDLPLWRTLTVQTLAGLDREHPGTWVVPMTLVNRGYRAEIHGGLRRLGHTLHHAVLVVPEPVLRERIDNDENDRPAREWRQDHVASAMAELPGLAGSEPGTYEIDASRAPEEVVADILVHIGQAQPVAR